MAWTRQGSFLAAVLLLLDSSGLHLCTPVTASPESCTCQSAAAAPLLNCSSAGLSSAPRRLRDAVAQLDLSHNLLEAMVLDRPHRNLRDVRLGSNGIARLSLCVDRTLGGRVVVGRRGRRCVSWAPALQLLSVERNQLERLPQGLGGSESLQVLQLSFNRISSLRPEDLNNLQQLKELHLQHNLIASLHPQMFQDLARLQVLDLSFNLLTSLHPLMHLSLSNIGADVQLSGNRWQCDCGMRSLRRRMAYDSSRGLQTWSLVCGSPSVLSGRDLLQLEEDDLNCLSAENRPELHRDVTVYSGSEILLSCSAKDSVWWTPGGQASSSQPQAGLVISDITERVTGLYVCVSEEHKVVSVFNLQISKTGGARRKSRSLPRTSQQLIPQNTPSRNERATQSDLNLAVCLSVFITFAIAFILGVLARPCIDVLWRRFTKKKSSSATISASSVEQRQYDNEAYFNGEEPENMGAHRERRVTFSTVNFREEGNSEYYNTVVGVKRVNLNNDAANGFEAAERDSVSESSFLPCSPEPNLSDITDTGNTQNMEFEPIPDPVVLVQRRNLSSCSDSSLSDKVFNKDQMIQGEQHSTPKSHQPAEDSFQQRADSTTKKVEVPQISIESTSEFPSESFADWPPHTKNTFLSDPGLWQENGEQFEFSDSVQSMSARSSIMCSSFDDTKLIVAPTSAEQNVDDSSSSGSYVDENEQTQYTVNSDQEEEDIRRNYNAGLKHDAGFEQQVHSIDPIRPSVRLNQGDYRYDTQRPAVRPEESFSYHSSDSDGVYTVKNGQTPENLSTDLDLQRIPQIKRRVAIKRLKASDSSSSDESIDEIENSTKKQEHREVDIVIKRRAPLPPPDSYSRVESTDRTMDHMQKRGNRQVTRLPIGTSQTGSHDSDAQGSALDLEDTIRIKRRLDIKAPSPASNSSSSSDGEDRTTRHTRPGKVAITRPQFQESQPVSQDPDRGWPAVDLEHTIRIKRHLDIKAPSADSDSSSIYESMDETTKKHEQGEVDLVQVPIKEYQSVSCDTMKPQLSAFNLDYDTPIRRRAPLPPADSYSRFESADKTVDYMQKQGDTQVTRLPIGVSQTGSHDSDTQWPALDLEDTIRIKRRLDIKAPSPASNSSSSSDSEDRTTHHTTRPGRVDIVGHQFQESETRSRDPDTSWPALDLEPTMRIKRRLDIKAPPASSLSASSDSGDQTINQTRKEEQGEVPMSRPPVKVIENISHDPQAQWPALDLEDTISIKRRLDIKAASPASDSSSSSNSEDEAKKLIKEQKHGEVSMARLPVKVSQNASQEPQTQWPALDLEDTIRIKRRLDIKAPSPASNSSSSSDSEDRTTHHTTRPGRVDIVGPQFQESETRSRDPDTSWPALDLEPTMRIKRRLDIKAPPASSLSASSDSGDQTINQTRKEEQGEVPMSRPPVKVIENISHDPQAQWPALDLEDTIRIKRRLDIKAASPASDSSSSSNSEDEATNQIKEQKHGEVSMARLPVKVSQNASQEPQTQWPALDLQDTIRIKRHLAVKAPSLDSESSSNSDTEDGTTRQTTRPGKVDFEEPQFHKSQTGSPDPDKWWPALDLEHTMRIKSRLDIKAPSPPSLSGGSMNHTVEGKKEEAIKISPHHSSSSSDQQEEGVEDLRYPQATVESKPHSRWPELDLKSALRVKKRLDIKAPSPPSESSSSSDHESEGWTTNLPANVEKDRPDVGISSYQPGRKLPGMNVAVPPVKRRLNIKGPSQQMDCSSNSDNESTLTSKAVKHERDKGYVGITDCGQQTKLHKSPRVHYINRRLDIKAPQPDLGLSSDSDSEDEYRDHANIGLGVSAISKATDKEFIRLPNTPVINIPHSPKTDHNIKLEKYTVVGEVGDNATRDNIGITPEINPELESRWATMNLGVSRFRKRLEITSNSPPNLPSSPPPDLPSSSSSESGTGSQSSRTRRQRRGVEIHAEPSLTTETKPVNVSLSRDGNTVEITERLRKDYNLPTTEDNSNPDPHSSLANIPHIRRALDIKAPLQRETSSSSKSEDETLGHSVPDLSLGIPRVKRYLNVKALLPEPSDSPPSSSYSDNEVTRYTENQSRHDLTDDDSLITYKRLIIKTSSPPGHSFSSTGKGLTVAQEGRFNSMGDRNASFAPKKVSNMSFEEVVKRRIGQPGHIREVDLPPEIRWTGVGHQLSDFSIPSMRRHQDGGLASPPPEPELPPPDSSSSESDDETRRIREKADKHPSLAFGRALDRFDDPPSSHNEIFKATSEDRTERKGLSALKAMSSERRKWDMLEEEGAPSLFDDRGSQGDTGFNYRRSEKDDEATQSLTRLLLSSTSVERRATDLLYDIPRYRRHNIGGIEPQQGAPPPVPLTSPPYEGVGLTPWRPQSRNRKESQNLAGYFDSTDANISEV